MTTIFYLTAVLLHYISIELGVSIGPHRLWSHRSYKARTPARILLMIAQTLGGQFTIYAWAWKHRVHHKWSDTDADPHNTLRGFFFVHIGWTMRQPHPEFYAKARTLDHSDLMADPVVYYQEKYYYIVSSAGKFSGIWPLYVQISSCLRWSPAWPQPYQFMDGVRLGWERYCSLSWSDTHLDYTPPGWSTRQLICLVLDHITRELPLFKIYSSLSESVKVRLVYNRSTISQLSVYGQSILILVVIFR